LTAGWLLHHAAANGETGRTVPAVINRITPWTIRAESDSIWQTTADWNAYAFPVRNYES
jgi:hypothetical protein